VRQLYVLNKYFLKYKFHLIFGIVFVALSNYFRVLMPQAIREALDYVFLSIQEYKLIDQSDFQASILSGVGMNLLLFGALVLGFALLMGLFMYFMRQTIIVMSRLIEYDMRNEIFTHYAKMDLKFFKENKTGDLMARISEDVSKVRMYLGPALLYFINLVSLFVIVIYSMLSVNVELTLYSLLPLPVLSISIYIVSNIINKKSAIIQKQLSVINSTAQEVYSGIRVIKSYVKENQFVQYFTDESNDFKAKSLKLARVNALFFPLMILLISISTLIVLYVGGTQVANSIISPGNIAEFIIYIGMLTWPITALGWIASLVQQASASQERINEFMLVEPSILDSEEPKIPLSWDIEFENVSFTYPETKTLALDNVSFKLNDGAKMAIMGRTASGKSTIAELLVRMYDIDSGAIRIGGIDIKDISLETLRKKLAYVPQDVFLFSDTIADNINFGLTQEEPLHTVKKYASFASIHEDIMDLPKQYETLVGERGVTLSGGQKQRISLARALIKNPSCIVLDDCLSAVDATTENNIVKHFNTSLANKTTLVITHRVHSQMDYDKILVLEKGKIAEFGTHNELIKNKSLYFDMFQQQSLDEVDHLD
jgi:ATP-binding cassette subfamily B multidrug efflux pump